MASATKCTVVMAPNAYSSDKQPKVFLSGSIDTPPSTWQSTITRSLSHLPITILNPHRSDWDDAWREDLSFPPFNEQVNWELNAMEAADVVAVYFNPATKAPVTLLELGLCVGAKGYGRGKVVVACPEEYWKRGNVLAVCAKFGVKVVGSVGELAGEVERALEEILEAGDRVSV